MGGGRIDCYLDIASLFSYVAFVDLLANLDLLEAHGVQVEFHPMLLGAIMDGAGNRPPWMLKRKAAYLGFDAARAARRVGIRDWATPRDLMVRARTASPLRALLCIKARWPPATLHAAMLALFRAFWTPPHAAAPDPADLRAVLFSAADVARIMDARTDFGDGLRANTARALELGAFGAPWLWVTDRQGNAEPFFGSDRFGHIYSHLAIAHHDVGLLPPESKL